MSRAMQHWIDYWDVLDERFWNYGRALERRLEPDQVAWQPVPAVASIGWNLQHLAEMLEHYLTHVFHAAARTVLGQPLVTMQDGAQDDGRFRDLPAILLYHQQVRPAYRAYLTTLAPADLDRPLANRPGAPTLIWAIGHIAEHESYHLGKCTLLYNLQKARR